MKIGKLFDSTRWMPGLANCYVRLQLSVASYKRKSRKNERSIVKTCLYYRICDQGYVKEKASYITKENCLANALACFPLSKVEWHVLADNVCDETYAMICKYIPKENIERVKVGHGAGTFRHVYEEAIQQDDNTLVYFLEDDYLHCTKSLETLIEAAQSGMADYMTLYDHPDKYMWNSPNPYVVNGGEKSKVLFIGGHHWKTTNSTTMTFAAFADTLKHDKKHFWRWTETKHPYDFHLFMELKKFAGRKLISPIPSLSTHGDVTSLAPGVNWEGLVIGMRC